MDIKSQPNKTKAVPDLDKDEEPTDAASAERANDPQIATRNQSRVRTLTSSGRFTNLLRSSLRFSLPHRKTPNDPGVVEDSPDLSTVTGGVQRSDSIKTTSSYSAPFCRICHDTSGYASGDCELESCGKLISPCLCDGSLKYVHEKCIQRWIEVSRKSRCELCHFVYVVQCHTKPVKEWRCCPLNWNEFRKLALFIVIYLLIQTCVAWAIYALITNLATPGISAPERSWQFWLKIFVIIIGVSSVGVFAYVQIRYCLGLCIRWRRMNNVYIVREPSKERIEKLRMAQRSSANHGEAVVVDTFTAAP